MNTLIKKYQTPNSPITTKPRLDKKKKVTKKQITNSDSNYNLIGYRPIPGFITWPFRNNSEYNNT